MMEADAPPPPQVVAHTQGDSSLICYLKTKFPLELFLRLTDLMDDSALLNLRLACRELEGALFPTFLNRFFTKRRINLSEPSLRRLVAISDEPRLASHISDLTIGNISNRYEEREDDLLILDSGYDVDLLIHAFSNMPNLKDVAIILDLLPLPRMANNASGIASTAIKRDLWRRTLRKVLRVLSISGRELRTLDVQHHGGSGGGLFIPDLYFSDSLREAFSRPLLHLKSLTLALDPTSQWTRVNDKSFLVSFLTIPQELEHLRLNFDRNASVTTTSEVLELLSLAAPDLPLTQHLTKLDLGKMTVVPDSLVSFVHAFAKTLTKVGLFRIGLCHMTFSTQDQQEPEGNPPRVQALLWKGVFKHLAAVPFKKLTGFYAGFLTEGASREHVAFLQASLRPAVTLPAAEYTGSDARQFLEDLSENAVIFPKQGRIGAVSDDENDEGDEDDDGSVDSLMNFD